MEPTTIGLNEATHLRMKLLKEEGCFDEMADAYRMAVAIAVSKKIDPPLISNRQTYLNVGSLDPDKQIYNLVATFYGGSEGSIYKMVERLADWGVNYLSDIYDDKGDISYADIIDETQILTND